MMRALKLDQIGSLSVVELPEPEPGPGEVRLGAAANWIERVAESAAAMISRVVSLDQGPAVFAELAAGADIPGKVFVRVSEQL